MFEDDANILLPNAIFWAAERDIVDEYTENDSIRARIVKEIQEETIDNIVDGMICKSAEV